MRAIKMRAPGDQDEGPSDEGDQDIGWRETTVDRKIIDRKLPRLPRIGGAVNAHALSIGNHLQAVQSRTGPAKARG